MSKTFKRIIGIIISLMVVCSAFGIYASANNSIKSPFAFVLQNNNEYKLTAPRPKYDNSLVYVKLDYGAACGTYFKAFGTHYTSSPYHEEDLTYQPILLYPGQEGHIYQYIFEEGYGYAMLGGKNGGTSTYSAGGEWSPDSDRYY